MQKYSHNSRRVQKELGGDVYALSGRVDSIEDDVTRLEGYEETTVKHFVFDISTSEEQTLQAVLENTEVMEWFEGTHRRDWTHFSIDGGGNTTLNGTYDKSFITKNYTGDILKYKQFSVYGGHVLASLEKTLKADTSTGALSYGNTNLDITGSYRVIHIYFKKGVLS